MKADRFKEVQWRGLNGSEELLVFEAISKQRSARKENAVATAIPLAEFRVNCRNLKKQGLQDRIMQSWFVLVD